MASIPIPSRGLRALAIAALALVAAFAVDSIASSADAQRSHRRAKVARVEIDDFAYKPQTLRVKRGTKVVFANRDRAPHTATRRGSFDTGRLRRGKAAGVRFKRRGTYNYICTIHPFMRGKIVVR